MIRNLTTYSTIERGKFMAFSSILIVGSTLVGSVRLYQQSKNRTKVNLATHLIVTEYAEEMPCSCNTNKLSLIESNPKNRLTKNVTSLRDNVKTRVQKFTEEKLTPIQKRRQQMQEFVGSEISEEEKEINHFSMMASVNLGIAALSLMYHPLIFLTIPIEVYCTIPFYRLSYKALVEERRVSSYTLESFLITGMLLAGYFYTEVVTTWFYLLGLKLMHQSENNTKRNLSNLFGTQPRSVWILTEDGVEAEIPFEQLQRGDIVVVSAGQVICVDGVITSGFASIDQHKLTGESQPVEKGVGDSVLASTIVLAGKINIHIEKAGQETVAMQIGNILDETADFQSSLQSQGEVIADQMTLPTLGLSALCYPFFGFTSSIAVLTNQFGYKIRLFAPASMLSFLNIASQKGILIKDGRSLELLSQVDTVVFDKTGTLTLEQPTVGFIHTYNNACEEDVLRYAAAAEEGQAHPIAKAIVDAAHESQLSWPKIVDAKYEMGFGIQVELPDGMIRVGSEKFMCMNDIEILSEVRDIQTICHQDGHSLVYVAFGEEIIGAVELHATIRPEAKDVITGLRKRGMSIYIISGDHEAPTKKLAETLNIDHYFASTLPENKANLVAQLQEEGKTVCFVGDGINDSIALKKANVSVSLRGATTIATDTAQIILMDSSLHNFEKMFDISHNFENNMKTNLFLSTVPSALCIGGIVFLHWGIVTGTVIAVSTLFIGIGNSIMPLFIQKKLQSN